MSQSHRPLIDWVDSISDFELKYTTNSLIELPPLILKIPNKNGSFSFRKKKSGKNENVNGNEKKQKNEQDPAKKAQSKRTSIFGINP